MTLAKSPISGPLWVATDTPALLPRSTRDRPATRARSSRAPPAIGARIGSNGKSIVEVGTERAADARGWSVSSNSFGFVSAALCALRSRSNCAPMVGGSWEARGPLAARSRESDGLIADRSREDRALIATRSCSIGAPNRAPFVPPGGCVLHSAEGTRGHRAGVIEPGPAAGGEPASAGVGVSHGAYLGVVALEAGSWGRAARSVSLPP